MQHNPKAPRGGRTVSPALDELTTWNARQWLLGLVSPVPPRPVWNGRDRGRPADDDVLPRQVA